MTKFFAAAIFLFAINAFACQDGKHPAGAKKSAHSCPYCHDKKAEKKTTNFVAHNKETAPAVDEDSSEDEESDSDEE